MLGRHAQWRRGAGERREVRFRAERRQTASVAHHFSFTISIQLESHGRGSTVYEALRADKGLTKSFNVVFEIDGDGVWRLDSF